VIGYLGYQESSGLSLVLVLIATVDKDLQAGRNVPHPNCGVGRVLMLPAFSVATLSLRVDLGFRDLDSQLLHDWKHSYGQERRLSSTISFSRRDPLNTVLADLMLKDVPYTGPGDLHRVMTVGRAEQRTLKAFGFGVLHVCREEIFGEQLGVVSAFAAPYFDNDFVSTTKDAPIVQSTMDDSVHS